jgi:hypothetical protein
MATLELISLHCVRQQDVTGYDEPELFVNGNSVYGPGRVKKGGTIPLRPRTAAFNGAATVRLTEVNPGKDKELGAISVNDDQLNKELTGEFHTSGSHYELTYKVV